MSGEERNDDDRPGLVTPDKEEARERKSATQTGKLVLGLSVVLLVITIGAALSEMPAVTSIAGGLFVALVVVGLVVLFSGERQRRRDAARRIAAAQTRPPGS